MSVQHQKKNNCQLTDAIQILPTELREKICKEFIKIKLRERADLGCANILVCAIQSAPELFSI